MAQQINNTKALYIRLANTAQFCKYTIFVKLSPKEFRLFKLFKLYLSFLRKNKFFCDVNSIDYSIRHIFFLK